jgi:hypothetical protein
MNRRAILCLTVAAGIGCSGTESTQPTPDKVGPPSAAISDGSHCPPGTTPCLPGATGNKDFFFLPPMVLPGVSILANWTSDGFNRSVSPVVEICPLNASSAAAVNASTPCRARAGFPLVISGNDVKKHFPPTADPDDDLTGLPGDWAHYHARWRVPTHSDLFYRVKVKVGLVTVGFADIHTVTNVRDLLRVDHRNFGGKLDGTWLQIPFRIEKFALCATPGVGPCTTQTVNLAEDNTVETNIPGVGPSGVDIPAQSNAQTTTITVQECNQQLPTDLPTFGPCLSVTANPPLDGPLDANALATVFICDITPLLPPGMDHEQQHRITLHRYDPPNLYALPHSTRPCATAVGSTGGGLRGFLADVVHGRLRSAGKRLASLVTPKPLYASTAFLDVGGGGETDAFSVFRFALPAKMEKVEDDGQAVLVPTTLNPQVLVTDLGGDAVAGATVRFGASNTACDAGGTAVQTDANGHASVPWAIGSSGAQYLDVCGRGLAVEDFGESGGPDGPRCTFDPFAPIQGFPHPAEFGPGCGGDGPEDVPEPHLIGRTQFSATGVSGDPLPLNYGAAGWSYQIDGTVASDWFSSALSPFGNTGTAPFRYDGGDGCSLIGTAGTPWPAAPTTYLYARRVFALAGPATVSIGVAIDNDVQVFLDGSDISATNQQGVVPNGDGVLVHENCPTQDSFTFSASLGAGAHIIAVRAKDRGGSSLLDLRVSIP